MQESLDNQVIAMCTTRFQPFTSAMERGAFGPVTPHEQGIPDGHASVAKGQALDGINPATGRHGFILRGRLLPDELR